MITFHEYCERRRLDEAGLAGNTFFRDFIEMVREGAHRHPFFAALVADPDKFGDFMSFMPTVLSRMSPQERQAVASGPQGIKPLVDRMAAMMAEIHPEFEELRWGRQPRSPQ